MQQPSFPTAGPPTLHAQTPYEGPIPTARPPTVPAKAPYEGPILTAGPPTLPAEDPYEGTIPTAGPPTLPAEAPYEGTIPTAGPPTLPAKARCEGQKNSWQTCFQTTTNTKKNFIQCALLSLLITCGGYLAESISRSTMCIIKSAYYMWRLFS